MLINSPNISGSLKVTGNTVITGSLTVLGGINATITGSATTASYVEYSNVANKPALVSSSAQIVGYGIFATTGSNQFNGNQAITGSLTVTGQVIAQTLNVQQVTSSIVFSSGSNVFGNTQSNTQQFTGSVSVTGSLTVNGAGTFSNSVTALRYSTGGTPSNTAGFTNSFYAESAFPSLTLSNTGGNTGKYTFGVTGGALGVWNNTTSAYEIFIDPISSGQIQINRAALFSSSVTATGGTEIPNGQFYRARRNSGNLLIDLLGIESGTDNTRLLITGDYNIKNGSLATLFNITTTGAATFSSSVTANGGMITTSANGFRDTDGTRNVGLYSNFTGGLPGIGTLSNHDFGVFTNSSEKMRITSGGFLKASNTGGYYGLSSAYHELRSNTTDNWTTVISNASVSSPYGLLLSFTSSSPNNADNWYIYCDDTGTVRFRVASNGNVTNRNGSYGSISDIKLKENITDATPKLDDLLKVKVRNYNLIGEETKQIGVIAQELEEVFPAMIDESEDFEEVEITDEEGNTTKKKQSLGTTTKSVKYSVFVPMLIKAIQEQQSQIEILKTKIEILEQS